MAQVRARIGDPDEQGIRDSEVYGYLNEAQQDLCLQLQDAALWSLGIQATAALTIDEAAYALPTDFMRERVVTYKTIVAKRWPILHLGALATNVYHTPTEANPYYYLWDGSYLWLRAGTKTAGSYYVDYLKVPTDMSVSVDPTLPSEFDPAMVTFAVSRCREQRGIFDESERLWMEYLGMCSVINSRYSGGLPYDNVPGDRR